MVTIATMMLALIAIAAVYVRMKYEVVVLENRVRDLEVKNKLLKDYYEATKSKRKK